MINYFMTRVVYYVVIVNKEGCQAHIIDEQVVDLNRLTTIVIQ